ncbi:MAG: helix-turn-helix transcriptional regulator [Lentisphaeria bacterium]|nr:helix-turn-helix transcriptional regulator [Lentisphaeria bacterium]
MLRQLLGKRLRILRMSKNYSQEAVAIDLNISPQTVSAWERGTRAIPIENLADVARYYDIPLSKLVHGLDQVDAFQLSDSGD